MGAAVFTTVATTLPTLLIFSQARHVLVVLPITFAAIAAAVPAAPKGVGRLGAALVVVVFGLAQAGWREERESLMGLNQLAAELRRVGLAICARASEGDLAAGDANMFTFCPMPTNSFALGGAYAPGSVYRTWWAGDTPPGPGWGAVPIGVGAVRLWRYRYDPDAAEPCAASRTPRGLPYLSALSGGTPPGAVELDPPCGGGGATP